MKKIIKNIKRKSNFILLVVLALLLVGCGSEVTTKSAKSEPEAVVKEETPKVEESTVAETIVEETTNVEEVQEVVEETVEEISVEETVVEEPIEEPYIPEGIDMESTLPGEEWIESFIGKVTEPVVVIYNDNTGRKEVVQAGSKVTVNPDEDIFGVYLIGSNRGRAAYEIDIKDLKMTDYYHLMIMDSEKMRAIPERNAEVYVIGAEENWVLEFTIIVE